MFAIKPVCHIFDEIVSLKNLFRAANATLTHGRRFRGEGAAFKFNLEKDDGAGYRGGNWNNASVNARASDRYKAAYMDANRYYHHGSRSVRVGPSGVGP